MRLTPENVLPLVDALLEARREDAEAVAILSERRAQYEALLTKPLTRFIRAAALVENGWHISPTAAYSGTKPRHTTRYGKLHILSGDGKTLCGRERGPNWSEWTELDFVDCPGLGRDRCTKCERKNAHV